MIKIFFISLFLLAPKLAIAQGFLDQLPCTQATSTSAGSCGLEDVVTGIILFIRFALGLMGALALLYFVWGGLQWLWSAGRSDRVQKGKDIMVNTTFALFIAFGSYLLLDFFINNVLNVKDDYRIVNQWAEADGPVSRGTACNTDLGRSYACNGNGACVSKCELKSEDTVGQDWRCVYVENPESLQNQGSNEYFEIGLCPGDEHNICMQVDQNGTPLLLQALEGIIQNFP